MQGKKKKKNIDNMFMKMKGSVKVFCPGTNGRHSELASIISVFYSLPPPPLVFFVDIIIFFVFFFFCLFFSFSTESPMMPRQNVLVPTGSSKQNIAYFEQLTDASGSEAEPKSRVCKSSF